MPRVIEADKVAEAIAWLNEYDFVLWQEIMKCIDKVPDVDAVPAVRCKDCKHWINEECNHIGMKGTNIGVSVEMWFCADGERREDG